MCIHLYSSIDYTGFEWQFDTLDGENVSTQGVPYDYHSIMHFSSRAFAKSTFVKTIEPLNFRDAFGKASYPTFLDTLHLNFLYCEGMHMYNYIVYNELE